MLIGLHIVQAVSHVGSVQQPCDSHISLTYLPEGHHVDDGGHDVGRKRGEESSHDAAAITCTSASARGSRGSTMMYAGQSCLDAEQMQHMAAGNEQGWASHLLKGPKKGTSSALHPRKIVSILLPPATHAVTGHAMVPCMSELPVTRQARQHTAPDMDAGGLGRRTSRKFPCDNAGSGWARQWLLCRHLGLSTRASHEPDDQDNRNAAGQPDPEWLVVGAQKLFPHVVQGHHEEPKGLHATQLSTSSGLCTSAALGPLF